MGLYALFRIASRPLVWLADKVIRQGARMAAAIQPKSLFEGRECCLTVTLIFGPVRIRGIVRVGRAGRDGVGDGLGSSVARLE